MSDNEPPISNPPQPNVDRRQFLKLFGLGTAAGVVAAAGGVTSVPEVQNMLPSPESRLESNNLGEFIPLYHLSVEFSQKYGTLPPFFKELQNTLISVANGNKNTVDAELLEQFAAEWGTKRDELPEVAKQAFEQLEYSFDPSVTAREQMRIKNITKNLCTAFPMLAIAAPKTVRYGDAPDNLCGRENILGCTDGENFIHGGNKGETNFAEITIHEWNHNLLDDFDSDKNNFQYITKQQVTGYFINTVNMLDRFYTSVATDTSENSGEFMFGYNKWGERKEAIALAKGCREMLGIDPQPNVDTASATDLTDSPQYNIILRQSLRRLLFEKSSLSEVERQQLSSLIGKEMQFAFHVLHYPALRGLIVNSMNSNSIFRQFADLNTEHQRSWVQLASSGAVTGTTALPDIRQLCGLSKDPESKTIQGNGEILQLFNYEDFGCTKTSEGFISENIWYEVHELPECPYDTTNKYMAWEFFDSVYSKDSGNHILLFAIPKNVDVSNLQVSFEDGVASLTFSDGKRLTVHLEIKKKDNKKQVNIDSSTINNENGQAANIWSKEKVEKKHHKWTQVNIGEVGPLGKLNPASNIPCILTSDPNEPYTHYYPSGDNKPKDINSPSDMVFFGDTALILPTEKGFQLLFRGLPTNLIEGISKLSTVDNLLDAIRPYGVGLLGEDRFKRVCENRPFKARITSKYHEASDYNGIVYSIVVGNEGQIRTYPLEPLESI